MDVGYVGFQFIHIVWVIAVGIGVNVALEEISGGDKSSELEGRTPFKNLRYPSKGGSAYYMTCCDAVLS
jgi:hypothetical protein